MIDNGVQIVDGPNAGLCSVDRILQIKAQYVRCFKELGPLTVVFTNGCFDIIHAGHISLFEQCCIFGQKEYMHGSRQSRTDYIVVVGVNTDESVRMQNKSPNRPINCFEDRVKVLSRITLINYIVGFTEETPHSLIEAIRPDILVKGEDYKDKTVIGQDIVELYGGEVKLVPMLKHLSTTKLIKRVKED